jgi:2-polyprenyl-3-methyl-5-hydroxy-6-metoxy-1,4-benzoquinol methylase
MKSYGEEIWEKKINSQDEVGVIQGTISSLENINNQTKETMSLFDTRIINKVKINGKVLDAGVGPMARFSIEFAKRGYDVTGVDISKTTLEFADKYVKKENLNIKLIKDDITSLKNLKEKYDFIFCFETFFHIPSYLSGITLMKFYNLLERNGKLFIHFNIPQKRKKIIKNTIYWLGHYVKQLFGKGFKVNVTKFTEEEVEEIIEKSNFEIENKFLNGVYLLKKIIEEDLKK